MQEEELRNLHHKMQNYFTAMKILVEKGLAREYFRGFETMAYPASYNSLFVNVLNFVEADKKMPQRITSSCTIAREVIQALKDDQYPDNFDATLNQLSKMITETFDEYIKHYQELKK